MKDAIFRVNKFRFHVKEGDEELQGGRRVRGPQPSVPVQVSTVIIIQIIRALSHLSSLPCPWGTGTNPRY